MKSKTVEECEHEWVKITKEYTQQVITNPNYKGGGGTMTFLVCKKCKLKKATDMELKK